MDYSLADLTSLTKAKRRTIQVLAEAGAIRANPSTERAGTGTHRRFSRDEAIVACLVNAFARRVQMPIGVILRLSSLVRQMIDDQASMVVIEKAIRNESKVYLILRGSGATKNLIEYNDGGVDNRFELAWRCGLG